MKIIKIGAVWCPGCLVMKKIWNNITDDYANLDITNLDYDMDNEEVKKYNPGKTLPIVIFLDNNNQELERLIGEQKELTLREKIDEYEDK